MPVKMWQGRRQVQTQLTLVMVAAAILAALALVLFGASETRRIDAYLTTDAKEHGGLLDRTIELEGSLLATLANDYSMWDEMVRFVETGDRTWASVNIDVGIRTYQVSAAWVFDAAGAPAYAVRDSTLKALLNPLPPGLSVKKAFGNNRVVHFFTAGPDGPVEVRGATIHPSEDDKRKTRVRGYFLVARAWNQKYLAELARLTGKTMRIEPAHGRTKPAAEIARQSGEITFTRPLPAPRGTPELTLTASLRPGWTAVALRSGRDSFLLQTTLALLAILGLTLVLWLWVTRPLGLLRQSLESGSARALKPLEHNRTEFGQLAQLTGQFFGQNAALVKEIAERMRAEQTLRESEEKYRLVADNVSEAILVVQDGNIVFANPSANQMLGYSHTELLMLSFNQLVHPAERWVVADGFSRRFAGEDKRGRFGFRIVRGYGETRHMEASAVYIEWKGRPATLSFLADVTERKLAEAEVAVLNRRNKLILDAAGEGIVGLDLTGRCTFINPAAAQMLGYDPSELVARRLHRLTHHTKANGEPYPPEECRICLVYDDGLDHTVTDELFWRKDGTSFPVEYTSRPVREGERLTGTVFTFKDITERKRAEEEMALKNVELVELNKVKNQFLGMAAHDLRNPLSVVSASSTFLLDDMSRNLPETKRADFLRRINSSSKFMLKLIDDLLDVAKIEAGKLDLELKEEDLCGLIDDSLTLNRMLADKKSIRLDFTPECGVPLLRFDRGKIEQVLNNLFSNAIKFSTPGTAVTVQVSRARSEKRESRGESVVVSVRDQGQGIPAGELDKLFKPFSKTSSRATAGESSTGLGLAICRKIVEGHGGRIWAESETGKGSVFSFSLPVASKDKSQTMSQ